MALPHAGEGVTEDCVALCVVAEVALVQVKVGFTTKLTAPVHSSFAGGGGSVPTQILKLAFVVANVEVVYTLTK